MTKKCKKGKKSSDCKKGGDWNPLTWFSNTNTSSVYDSLKKNASSAFSTATNYLNAPIIPASSATSTTNTTNTYNPNTYSTTIPNTTYSTTTPNTTYSTPNTTYSTSTPTTTNTSYTTGGRRKRHKGGSDLARNAGLITYKAHYAKPTYWIKGGTKKSRKSRSRKSRSRKK
jgi:hypothetical protein